MECQLCWGEGRFPGSCRVSTLQQKRQGKYFVVKSLFSLTCSCSMIFIFLVTPFFLSCMSLVLSFVKNLQLQLYGSLQIISVSSNAFDNLFGFARFLVLPCTRLF
ncbi:hypothetical protein I3842_04G037800 [Carya illinoinensis]|uniref:Uncharacterized protein n=1 Tax=Carya illinoinensis TaxID=32201 RepID=A0A922JQ87_CARIL|nr:hypothetical protein I3842_04G037800 [Carya illinoinensis]